MSDDASNPRDYERSDADPRLIAALAAGVAAFLIVTPFGLLATYPGADHLGALPSERPKPQPPRLQVQPKADLDQLHRSEDARLASYGWIDQNHQVVRVPIERAMGLLADRGLTGWPSLAPAPK